jgi:hypothetical protein
MNKVEELNIESQLVGSTEVYLSNGMTIEIRHLVTRARLTGKSMADGTPEITFDAQSIITTRVERMPEGEIAN